MDVVSLGLHSDLMVRRLSGSRVDDRGDHIVVMTPENPTFYWGNFVAVADPLGPGDAARWRQVCAAAFPAARHLALAVDGTTGDAGDPAELADLGVTVELGAVLTASRLRPAPIPPGVSVRRLHTDDDWAQALALRRACDDRPDTEDQRRFHENTIASLRALAGRGVGGWFGAFVDGRMLSGLGVFADGSGLARYQHVETHPEHRRRGLARTVLLAAGQYARDELDARTLVIVADPDYVAIDLYRSVGFEDAERQVQLTYEPPETRPRT